MNLVPLVLFGDGVVSIGVGKKWQETVCSWLWKAHTALSGTIVSWLRDLIIGMFVKCDIHNGFIHNIEREFYHLLERNFESL